jgi:hypothetical protein
VISTIGVSWNASVPMKRRGTCGRSADDNSTRDLNKQAKGVAGRAWTGWALPCMLPLTTCAALASAAVGEAAGLVAAMAFWLLPRPPRLQDTLAPLVTSL